MDSWRDVVQRLVGYLSAQEERFALLGQIDRAILDERISIEEIDRLALSGLRAQLRVRAVHLVIRDGDSLETWMVDPVTEPLLAVARNAVPQGAVPSRIPSSASRLPHDSVAALLRVATHEHSDGALVFVAESEAACSAVEADPLCVQVASQLVLAHRERRERDRRLMNARFQEMFQTLNLDFDRCLAFVLNEIRALFEKDPRPPDGLVQILTAAGAMLHVQATTGDEPPNTRVIRAESATGSCLDSGEPSRISDPTEDPNYKAIGARRGLMRSELVVPLTGTRGGAYGAFNIEFQESNAFKPSTVSKVVDIARVAGPLLKPLFTRRAMALRDRRLMFYPVRTMCDRLVLLYRHQLSSPVNAARGVMDLVKKDLNRLNDEQRTELLGNLGKALNRIDDARNRLFEHFDNLVNNEAYDLDEMIRSALKPFEPITDVAIAYAGGSWPRIYCSRLLREHLINVIQNAVDSVQVRLSNRPDPPGAIELSVETLQSREVETMNRYLVLTIRDNGKGIADDERDIVFAPFRSTKGTMGVALAAARSYMFTIGGTITYESSPTPGSSYCAFELSFQVYNPEFHGAEHASVIDFTDGGES